MNIVTMTLAYVPSEDRIRLEAVLEDKRPLRLWLTQRISRALVAQLGRHLERIRVSGKEHANAKPGGEPQVERSDPSPVPLEPVATYLVDEINLQLGPHHVGMGFIAGRDVNAAAVMNRALLRRWVDILRRQFVAAEWPLDEKIAVRAAEAAPPLGQQSAMLH